MASSGIFSSTRPQVFVNFRGDLRTGFISFLEPALQHEYINVFIDELELRGRDLQNLFLRIEASKIALVIFSKDYANSEWCLDELAKIKECMDLGNLVVIPIFYKVQPSDLKNRESCFGEYFTNLKSKYSNEEERIRKWEEALTSIPQKFGLSFPETSNKTEREFIKSIVIEVKRVLDDIKETQIQKPDVNSQHVIFIVGKLKKSDLQLKINHSHNERCWIFESIFESPNEPAIEVAIMKRLNYLELCGKLDPKKLIYGKQYEVVFVVKVEDTMTRWANPATAQLMIPDNPLQERQFQFIDLAKNKWIDIQVGIFVAQPHEKEIAFYIYQHQSNIRMTGLQVKGAIIRPVE
ncbi:unnamed protein product [Cochlearia groenlandica]